MTAAIISHATCALHDNGHSYHPECAERLDAINNQLITSGVDWITHHYDAQTATKDQLLRAHKAHYIEQIFASAPSDAMSIDLDGDTSMNQHSLAAALLAAGAATQAVDLVMDNTNQQQHAFCMVRPPGHHAGRAHSAGFCIFNNIAIAAQHALAAHGLERVAIIDFDVHHGDGTEDIVQGDERILFCSSFQHPFYPYRGADTQAANILNIPLPAGTASTTWREAVQQQWLPALARFQPELILISAGFDSHLEDDMGGFKLVEADYVWITEELCQLAKRYSNGRIVSCLEGGYDFSSLGRSVAAHVKMLAEFS